MQLTTPVNPTFVFVYLAILVGGLAVILWMGWWIERRMARVHPEKYRELGGSAFQVDFRAAWRWLRFVHLREYEALGDTRLASTCNFLRIFEPIFLVVWLYFFITGVVSGFFDYL